jgi:hypothetical protein
MVNNNVFQPSTFQLPYTPYNILNLLGGKPFIQKTKSSNFVGTENSLTFKINGIKMVFAKIISTENIFTIEFFRWNKGKGKIILSLLSDITGSDLEHTFMLMFNNLIRK